MNNKVDQLSAVEQRALLFMSLLEDVVGYTGIVTTDSRYTKENIIAKLNAWCRTYTNLDFVVSGGKEDD